MPLLKNGRLLFPPIYNNRVGDGFAIFGDFRLLYPPEILEEHCSGGVNELLGLNSPKTFHIYCYFISFHYLFIYLLHIFNS